jgi:hypothetical protein
MIPKQKVELLGNLLEEIKKLYHSLSNTELFSYSFYNPPKETTLSLLGSFIPKGLNAVTNTFLLQCGINFREGATPYWHIDCPTIANYEGVIIVAYPYPTHIMKVSCAMPKQSRYNDRQIELMIKNGKAEVIKPKLGDIYLIGRDVIHRSNPAIERDVKYLCMRVRLWKGLPPSPFQQE